MYRCQICSANVGPRLPMFRQIVYRLNGQIAREIPVCGECKRELLYGHPLARLIERYRTVTRSDVVSAVIAGVGKPVKVRIKATRAVKPSQFMKEEEE